MEDETISSESVHSGAGATNTSDTKLSDELMQKQQELEKENQQLKSSLTCSRQKIERLTTPALSVFQDDPIKRNALKARIGEDNFNRVQSTIADLHFSKEQADRWGDELMEQTGEYDKNQQQGAQEDNIDNKINAIRTDVISAFSGMGNQEMANKALYMSPNELLACFDGLKALLEFSRNQQQYGQENIHENTHNNQVAKQPLDANAPQVSPTGANDTQYDHKIFRSKKFQDFRKENLKKIGFQDGKLPDEYLPLQESLRMTLYTKHKHDDDDD